MNIKWHFPDNGGGLAAGFNDGAIDHFKGQRLSSLVREVVQNSLDARASGGEPVRVHFQLKNIKKLDCPEISGLEGAIIAARDTALAQELEHAVSFYDHALKELKNNEIGLLCVHDENTQGLTGPINGPNGSWFALTKGAGLSQKISEGSLGSFGHGSKAPFILSDVRSLFYLTKIMNSEGEIEGRFQGKSILQSHKNPETGQLTQGTGFFGEVDGCLPLVSDEIPLWAKQLREESTPGVGTSLFIPYTFYDEGLYPETAITVIANFYFAISNGLLEVVVGDKFILNKETVEQQFWHLRGRLDEEQDEIDVEYVSECFKSVETIVKADEVGEQEVPNFGLVKWYLRVNPDVLWKNVAIARQNGMLITRQPPNLMRFSKVRNFDLFVCVMGKEGSELLKVIENPQHDNFQFERIDDLDKRQQIIRRYRVFSNKMREVIARHAGIDAEDEILVDELADLFSEISESETSENASRERSKAIQLSLGNFNFRAPPKPRAKPQDGDGANDEIMGGGAQGGDGIKKTQGGPNPSNNGITPLRGSARESDVVPKGKHYKVKNLRVRPPSEKDGNAVIYFDAPDTGKYAFSLLKSGEVGADCIEMLLSDGEKAKSIEIEISKDNREAVVIQLDHETLNMAFEATIDELAE
jgi:hypothetical protein